MIPDKYLPFINKTEVCWLWIGPVTQEGYPAMLKKRVARVIWESFHGPIPKMNCAFTTCKNKLCVRPDHIFVTRKVPKRKSFEERFFDKIEKTDSCWNWIGARAFTITEGRPVTYGAIHNADGEGLVHRAMWELVFGKIPEKVRVLHKCDNPRCVNPEHLFLGDQHNNMIDMLKKNRGRTKLDWNKVRDIRSKFEQWSGTRPDFCHFTKHEYNVHYGTIMSVVKYDVWIE